MWKSFTQINLFYLRYLHLFQNLKLLTSGISWRHLRKKSRALWVSCSRGRMQSTITFYTENEWKAGLNQSLRKTVQLFLNDLLKILSRVWPSCTWFLMYGSGRRCGTTKRVRQGFKHILNYLALNVTEKNTAHCKVIPALLCYRR